MRVVIFVMLCVNLITLRNITLIAVEATDNVTVPESEVSLPCVPCEEGGRVRDEFVSCLKILPDNCQAWLSHCINHSVSSKTSTETLISQICKKSKKTA